MGDSMPAAAVAEQPGSRAGLLQPSLAKTEAVEAEFMGKELQKMQDARDDVSTSSDEH